MKTGRLRRKWEEPFPKVSRQSLVDDPTLEFVSLAQDILLPAKYLALIHSANVETEVPPPGGSDI